MDSPSVYVVDANILIDLYIGGLLREVFRLPIQLVTPDVIIAELQEPAGELLLEYGLQSRELSGDQVLEVLSLVARYRQVSTNDLFALVLARALQGTLLTGDRRLGGVAEQEGVLRHGTLWILDEMVEHSIVTSLQAARGLERMLSHRRRLPASECQKQLNRWRRKGEDEDGGQEVD